MIQAARIIGIGLATTGLIGAGIMIIAAYFMLDVQLEFSILNFALAVATGSFAFIIAFLLLYVMIRLFLLIIILFPNFRLIFNSPPKPHAFNTLPKLCGPTALGLLIWPVRPRVIYAGSVTPPYFLGKTVFGHQITSVVIVPHSSDTVEICKLQLEHVSGAVISNLPVNSEILELIGNFV